MATPKTVSLHTLGCKLNYSETSSIAKQFEQRGYHVIDHSAPADIFVLNTCSVTDFADRKCRKAVRQVLRNNPETRVVITGCYAQLKPKEIAEIPGVDIVLGAAEKFSIVDYVERLGEATERAWVHAGDIEAAQAFAPAHSIGDRTRSFLKVQDGCDYKCSFCTIPLARGKSRSSSVEDVVLAASQLGEQGIKEIVLTGVNIGDFKDVGEDGSVRRFIDLIKALDRVDSVARIRISSIEPNLCTDEIIEFVASSNRFMPHFHMPLQSGNNKQLQMMQRRYQRELYAQRVEKVKSVMPHACIGVDVIVGFPGESDEDFRESYRFIQEMDISYLHVFTYSERPNTPAPAMAEAVPMEVRRERNAMLRNLSEKKKLDFYNTFEGTSRPALIESSRSRDKVTGYTDNYVKIELSSKEASLNSLVTLTLGQYAPASKAMSSSRALLTG